METSKIPYSVWTPPMVSWSGGIRVMWALVDALKKKGQAVTTNQIIMNTEFVAVYPEICWGNPFNSKRVARWLLNKPGRINGPTEFDKSEQMFAFSKLFNVYNVPDERLMFLPAIDINIFHKTNFGKRTKRCYYVSKGFDMHLKELEGVEELKKEMAVDQQALADYLNECEVLYSYDPVSAIFECARLCGCRVVIIPNGEYTKKEFSEYEPGMNGLSFGLDEHVELDVEAFQNHYVDLITEFDRKLDKFIELTQNG